MLWERGKVGSVGIPLGVGGGGGGSGWKMVLIALFSGAIWGGGGRGGRGSLTSVRSDFSISTSGVGNKKENQRQQSLSVY